LLILAAGLQSGVTFQHLVVAVQEAFVKIGVDPEIAGLVLHAHPVDAEAWASVRNSFGGRTNPRLLALWLTYLPGRSPFADELDVLRLVEDEWIKGCRQNVADLLKARLEWLDPTNSHQRPAQPKSPFLSPEAKRLRRTSIYGEIDDRLVVPAVGSALTESFGRNLSLGAPDWLAVDMQNVLRSYFDGILHAAVIRWVSAERAWWGGPNECASLLAELKGRFASSDDWQMLLPELLLATAQGKIPDEGARYLLAEAETELAASDDSRWSAEVLDYVCLTYAVASNLWMPPD
jgi:hypothetical protein